MLWEMYSNHGKPLNISGQWNLVNEACIQMGEEKYLVEVNRKKPFYKENFETSTFGYN